MSSECAFCRVAAGGATRNTSQADVVLHTELTTAFIGAKWWVNNPGHVLVIPNAHYENLYDTTDDVLGAVYATVRRVALAMKTAYGCNGISTRQHNEPAGNQDVFHLHVHVFPRWRDDELYEHHNETWWPSAEEKLPYAEKLGAALAKHD
ncbi:MAG TPA: HIT family protein [Gaiellaceae bacterium]